MTEHRAVGNDPDDLRLAGLIRRAGPRQQPSADAVAAVRAAVAAEWRAMAAQQRARRRTQFLRLSAVAAALVAGLAVWLAAPLVRTPDGAPLATLARVSGVVETHGGGLLGRWAPASAGATVGAGSEIRSAGGGRAALAIGRIALRLDEQSDVEILAADRIALKRGAVYVDADAGAGDAPLVIETPYGEVRHLGTQYETRLTADALRLRVREGRVELSGGGRTLQGAAGEQLLLGPGGEVQRSRIARAGGEWAWVEELAPEFDINERSLAEFLQWVGRETGRDVTFGSPAAERAARSLVLRGSVRGMAPAQALSAVLMTTELQAAGSGEVLHIDLRTGDQ